MSKQANGNRPVYWLIEVKDNHSDWQPASNWKNILLFAKHANAKEKLDELREPDNKMERDGMREFGIEYRLRYVRFEVRQP